MFPTGVPFYHAETQRKFHWRNNKENSGQAQKHSLTPMHGSLWFLSLQLHLTSCLETFAFDPCPGDLTGARAGTAYQFCLCVLAITLGYILFAEGILCFSSIVGALCSSATHFLRLINSHSSNYLRWDGM